MKNFSLLVPGAILSFFFSSVPLLHAQTTIEGVLTAFIAVFNLYVPLAVAVAVIVFFWGLAMFIRKAGDDQAVLAGKKKMFWGIIALFILVSIWGIVGFIGNVFDVGQGGSCSVTGMNAEGVYNCFINPVTGGAL